MTKKHTLENFSINWSKFISTNIMKLDEPSKEVAFAVIIKSLGVEQEFIEYLRGKK